MRENRTYGSEGGGGSHRSLPLSVKSAPKRMAIDGLQLLSEPS